ncbi:restriction endonuclease subunit S [Treponema sp.]|uniref:restriction endonuclease subunit S n=1 Tax=Treponema sp. TaxID=166 RepID=UPI003FD73A0B
MKNETCLLKEIADIRTGFSFRSKLESDPDGNVMVIQLKELSENNTVDSSTAVKISMQEVSGNYLLQKGDLVFRSRGLDTTAAIMAEHSDNTILSAPFQRIRISDIEQIMPEYLLWYINSKEAQLYFATNKTGTSVSMISTAVLADLSVVIPSVEIQKKIIEINRLSMKEIELQEELIRKKRMLTESILLKTLGL